MLKRSPERLAVREDMFDSLLAMGEIRLSMGEPGPALESMNRRCPTRNISSSWRAKPVFRAISLAISYKGIADYHSYLALHGPASDRWKHQAESLAWVRENNRASGQLATRGVAIPFSANREREVQGRAHPFCPERNLTLITVSRSKSAPSGCES